MRLVLVLLSLALLAHQAFAQTRAYICTYTDSNGFYAADQTGDRFQREAFAADRLTMKFDGNTAAIKLPREKAEDSFTCERPFPTMRPMLHRCIMQLWTFVFDEQNLRFTFSQLYGYVSRSRDSITVSYGDCQKSS